MPFLFPVACRLRFLFGLGRVDGPRGILGVRRIAFVGLGVLMLLSIHEGLIREP